MLANAAPGARSMTDSSICAKIPEKLRVYYFISQEYLSYDSTID